MGKRRGDDGKVRVARKVLAGLQDGVREGKKAADPDTLCRRFGGFPPSVVKEGGGGCLFDQDQVA